MSVAVETFSLAIPNPNPVSSSPLKKASMNLRPSAFSSSLRFESLSRNHTCRVSIAARSLPPGGLGLRFLPLDRCYSPNRSFASFAASHEDSKPSEIEVERKSDLDLEAKESEEEWKQVLASFKEQALKIQSVSQEAYELYSKKAMVVLKETAVQLKIQADKAGHDLSVIAKETTVEGKEYLSAAAENSPDTLKDVIETFASSTDDVNEISKVYDFYLGIPYGLLLFLGGFLSFMVTGSISAIRFGVILGGTLLALSVSSLRSWRRGESFALAIKGQAAIAGILFLREIRLLSQKPSFSSYLATLISGVMLLFYIYRIGLKSARPKGSDLKHGTED
ncbi:protein FATTY ACID EXPORT 3, chloroplastic [Malania oleifera]|uniref:protein FATTY ACID EXPORT 3, chloroplastic n=1 Tax=Malania oleifera TaxID=397392 RepID=UPI0025AE57BA|nr:protein FATTY ACID EXPORT 3, chloroplastic [Malania oleifera]XP_057971053.1 protein FATTY ACID EXPORT 3, chloroplastic [Malania oleifera]